MRRLLGSVAAALLITGAVAQPAHADAATHPRVTTLAASSQYIVVAQRTSSTDLTAGNLTSGTVTATDITGQRMTLPGFDLHHRVFVTGSMVVEAENSIHTTADRQTVRWFDLNTRRGGTATGAPNEVLLGAGPDGWLTGTSAGEDGRYGTPERISYVHRDGTRTDLGVPYPDGQFVDLAVSDTGIVLTPGVSDESSFLTSVLYQPWKAIGTSWRSLYTTKDRQVAVDCAPSSTTMVACSRTAEEGDWTQTYGLISLSGAGARWMADSHPKACGRILFATLNANLVAIENSDAGVCTKGKLYRFTFGGALVSGGSHHYSSTGILTGLGGASGGGSRIVVSSLGQRHVDALTGVTRAPKVLVRV